jgi:two-component system sensor histidine kinase HydH
MMDLRKMPMKRRLVTMGIALLSFAALSAVNVVIFRGMAELSRLESRNDSEQTLNTLFAGLRTHDNFGSAIESAETLKRKIIGVSVTGSDGRILYSWGTVSEPTVVPLTPRTYIENPKNGSLLLLLRPPRDNPPPPPPADADRAGPADSFMRDTLRQAEHITLEIRQAVFWRAARTRAALFPTVEVVLAALVIFMRLLILRNGEYRGRIEEQKNLVMLGTAASTLAHEIKNPLLAIRLQTGILERTLAPESQRELEIINSEVSRLSTLSHRVNDILRDPIGRPAAIDPAHIAREVSLRLCGRDLVHGPPKAAKVRIDPERLRSILENLVRNALESGGRQEEVAIEIERTNGKVRIDVADRGSGVAPENQERIFDPFFTTKSRGTGIGLTICRRFVTAAGGTITIESRPEGGSSARVLLPLAANHSSSEDGA